MASKRKREDTTAGTVKVSAFAALARLRSVPVPSLSATSHREKNEADQNEAGSSDGGDGGQVTAVPSPVPKKQKKKPAMGLDDGKSTAPDNKAVNKKNAKPSAETPGTSLAAVETAASRNGRNGTQQTRNEPPDLTRPLDFVINGAKYVRKDDHVWISMAEGDSISILGSYGLDIISGGVALSGAFLYPEPQTHWIHAPSCSSLPTLICPQSATLALRNHPSALNLRELARLNPVFRSLWNHSSTENTPETSDDTFKIVKFASEDAVDNISAHLKGAVLSQKLLALPDWNMKIANITAEAKSPAGGGNLGSSNSNGRPVRVFVCGPKSSGKSTFSKMLSNRLLTVKGPTRATIIKSNTQQNPQNKVPGGGDTERNSSLVYLDIDPGQPEYAPAGLISLVHVRALNLSSAFTHPSPPLISQTTNKTNKIILSHSIAASTPSVNPELYISCVLSLFKTYLSSPTLSRLPLIINTCGWAQGGALDIFSALLPTIRPTDTVYMTLVGLPDTVDLLESLSKTVGARFARLESQGSTDVVRTAVHLRTMQIMSYFHIKMPDITGDKVESNVLDWDPRPMTDIPPLLARYHRIEDTVQPPDNTNGDDDTTAEGVGQTGKVKGGISAIIQYHHTPHPQHLPDLLLGSIVSIVELDSSTVLRSYLPTITTATALTGIEKDLPVLLSGHTLDPSTSNTLGLALVRSMDPKHRTLSLLTPILRSRLADAVRGNRPLVLVLGSFDLPRWSYVEGSYLSTSLATSTAASGSAISDKNRKVLGSEDSRPEVPGGGREGVESSGEEEEIRVITDQDTSEDSSQGEQEIDFTITGTSDKEKGKAKGRKWKGKGDKPGVGDVKESGIPWVEVLKGQEKRGVGSKIWKVRRDWGKKPV